MKRARRAAAAFAAAALLGGAVLLVLVTAPGSGQAASGPLTAQPVLGEPDFTLFGASPQEAPGEVWAYGGSSIYRSTDADDWRPVDAVHGPDGASASGLTLGGAPLAGDATAAGGVAVLGQDTNGSVTRQVLVVRDPGGSARELGTPTGTTTGPPPATTSGATGSTPATGTTTTTSTQAPSPPAPAGATTATAPPAATAASPSSASAPSDTSTTATTSDQPPAAPQTATTSTSTTTAPATTSPSARTVTTGSPPPDAGVTNAVRSAPRSTPRTLVAHGVTPTAPVRRRPSTRRSTLPRAATAAADASSPQPLLHDGESLFATVNGTPALVAAVSDADHTGALVVPVRKSGPVDGVLRYDGTTWTREEICTNPAAATCTAPTSGFKVLGIDATTPTNAWLLVSGADPDAGVALMHRVDGPDGPTWRSVSLGDSPFTKAAPDDADGTPLAVAGRAAGQPLVVTDAGLWADATLKSGDTTLDATLYVEPSDDDTATVRSTWCDAGGAAAGLCDHPLDSALPTGSARSFAWSGGGGPYGQRVITGVGNGAILTLTDSAFDRFPGIGGNGGTGGGAAFSAVDDGWLGSPLTRVSRSPLPTRLQPWPTPFRRPLTAVVAAPDGAPGQLGSQALAVGDQGEVARYTPGSGWQPEFLTSASGARARPRLRGVAWPESDRAYAVGDGASMWLWRKQTGLWEPDPAEPPNLVRANFTGIAFDPVDPSRGYAIGKQGVLLHYDREWTQDQLPADLSPDANFTSIAFAGHQALVTYQYPRDAQGDDAGGLLVNDGSGWKVDAGLASALAAAPARVAGLPDGGAVVASTEGQVVERDGPDAAWTAGPAAPPSAGYYPSALAAFRDGGHVSALMSVERPSTTIGSGIRQGQSDVDQLTNPAPPGQAPLLTDPYPLEDTSHLLRQVGDQWRDEEHEAYPVTAGAPAGGASDVTDQPLEPDSVLALLVAPDGTQGWAVGGDTGVASFTNGASIQTAGIMRYPGDGPPPTGATQTPVQPTPGVATLAVGGGDSCLSACADLAHESIGPDVWLPAAIASAARTPDVRAFLNTGPGVAQTAAKQTSASGYAREQRAYAQRLETGPGALPTFTAPTASDIGPDGTLTSFMTAFAGAPAPLGQGPAGPGITPLDAASPDHAYYAFDSTGTGGSVRVVVLDYSQPTLGDTQTCWLAGQISAAGVAGTPVVVVGERDLSPGHGSPNAASDAAAVATVLVTGSPPAGCPVAGTGKGASAYFFTYPQQNRTYPLVAGGRSIPSFGSGTLGYVTPPLPGATQFLGASGFELAGIDVAHRNPTTNVAPVSVRLIPSISELAIDATDGTLLRRSQPALFDALARRPRAGTGCSGGGGQCSRSPDPYVPIPSTCSGADCASGLFPEYRFSSANPDIAGFVAADPNSTNPRRVLLDAKGNTTPSSTSGLLCPFNAGSTTVTVTTGGLSYSLPVTVQPGTVARPCGTVPLTNPPRGTVTTTPTENSDVPDLKPQPTGAEPSAGTRPAIVPRRPPARPVSRPRPRARPRTRPRIVPAATLPFLTPPLGLQQVPRAILPPPPAALEPTPPSGTSAVNVFEPATSPQRQDEDEEAMDVAQSFVAHDHDDSGRLVPSYVPLLVLLLALGGTGAWRGLRAGRNLRLAHVRSDSQARSRPRR